MALFTRPRRFGKTFALEMLHTFFEKTEKSNAHLFKGTKVWADPAHRAEQGRYSGVILELKSPKLPPRASQTRIAAALEAAARSARDQIDEKRYAEELERELAERDPQPFNRSAAQGAPSRVLRYGVGFLGKHVALAK